MNSISQWMSELKSVAKESFDSLISYSPSLLGALVLILAGWLVARLLKMGTLRLGKGINRSLDRMFPSGGGASFRFSSAFITLMSLVVFWAVILIFVSAGARILGFTIFASWFDRAMEYLPTLLGGVLIIIIGAFISSLARDLATSTARSAGVMQSKLLGGIVQAITLIVAVVIGLDQMGIDVDFLATIIGVLVGSVFGGFALVMALGSKTLVSNLIGSYFLQQQYQPGQLARMGEVQGTILEITPTSVILNTEEGRMIVPAKVFNDECTLLVVQGETDE